MESNRESQTHKLITTLNNRSAIIERIRTGPKTKHDLYTALDTSRRSIDRAIDALLDVGVIWNGASGYKLTLFGRFAADIHGPYHEQIQSLVNAAAVLEHLPYDAPLDCRFMDDVSVTVSPEAAPQAAFGPVAASINRGERVQGIAPVVMPQYVDVFYGEIVEHGTEVELILPTDVIAAIVGHYSEEWQSAIMAANCTIWSVETVPTFGVIVVDEEIVWIGAYQDSGGGLAGTLRNDSQEAVEWAVEFFDQWREKAEQVFPATTGDVS